MKEAPRPPPVVSRDRQPSYTRPGSSLPSRGKEGSERAMRGGEGGPIYEWRKRPARQPSDPWRPSGNIAAAGIQAGKIWGSERPGRWAGGSPLLQGGRQFLPAPLQPVCVLPGRVQVWRAVPGSLTLPLTIFSTKNPGL